MFGVGESPRLLHFSSHGWQVLDSFVYVGIMQLSQSRLLVGARLR
jgi:hypothetical protein